MTNEEKIINTAEKLFLEKGLNNVETSELAKLSGVNRTSIYRYYSSKIEMAFPIMQKYLTELFTFDILDEGKKTGYQKYSEYMLQAADRFCANIDKVRFIRSFDIAFEVADDLSGKAAEYEEWMRNFEYPGMRYYLDGLKDSSILDDGFGKMTHLAIVNTLMGLASRVLPRESTYIYEYGIGRTILLHGLQLQLRAIRMPTGQSK